jgi:hypothetical protein
MNTLSSRILIIIVALFFTNHTAFAQYVWLNEKGIKQFSDQPPPPSVPDSKILKSPAPSKEKSNADSSDNAGANTDITDAPTNATQPESVADKEQAYKKRRAEAAAKEKKSEDEARVARAKADNCLRMRQYKRSLESGQRIPQTDDNGQKSYMSDEKREEELNQINQNIADCEN